MVIWMVDLFVHLTSHCKNTHKSIVYTQYSEMGTCFLFSYTVKSPNGGPKFVHCKEMSACGSLNDNHLK